MKCLFILFLVCSSCFSNGQTLLANGGFEDENICSEFHVNCSPEAWISTSDAYDNFFKMAGLAHSGQHCMAIEAGHANKKFIRSFIRTQMLCRLRANRKYRIEFYVKSRHAILDSIGLFFTPYDFLFEKQVKQTITPTIYLCDATIQHPLKDTGWQKVSTDFIAIGTEIYLTIGNFSKTDITGPTGIPLENNFLVFLDDISLLPLNPNEKICDDWKNTKENIYDFDARHQYLATYIKSYWNNPPAVLRPGKTVLHFIDSLRLPDIFFATDQSQLIGKNERVLDSLCNAITGREVDSLVVEGYTDSTGANAQNLKLSGNRALSVANYLRKRLLNGLLIVTRGCGDLKPVADNHTVDGRRQNRRVELFVYIREGNR